MNLVHKGGHPYDPLVADWLQSTVRENEAMAACGLHVCMGVTGGRFERYSVPGRLECSDWSDGSIYNMVCGAKPLLFCGLLAALENASFPIEAAEDGRPSAIDLAAHRLTGAPAVDAMSYLNASDPQRAQIIESTLSAPISRSSVSQYTEVSALVILRSLCSGLGCEDINGSFQALGLRDSFDCRPRIDPGGIGCLIEYDSAHGGGLPLLHDRSPDFYASDWYGNVGGYSTVEDLCRFYSQLLICARGESVLGLPSPRVVSAELSQESSGGFALGMMLGLDAWGIKTDEWAVGHIGFMRSSLGYAEPRTGFVLGAVGRGLDFERVAAMPDFWTQLVRVCRARVLGR